MKTVMTTLLAVVEVMVTADAQANHRPPVDGKALFSS
jgi:hypothetical protein